MRRLSVVPAWQAHTAAGTARLVDERVLPLLGAVGQSGTLTGAAKACGVPYRTAWGLLEEAERDIGVPLVTLARGRGASLTALAVRWLALDDDARRTLDRMAPGLDVRRSLAPAAARTSPALRIAASHDIALAHLKDRWAGAHGVALHFHGSTESLDALRAGRVGMAGFHVALERQARPDPLLARLDPARDALLRFITRTQGLIVPRGNPRRVRSLRDIATRRLSLVNRQPGSGTRLLLDRMLADAGIATDAIAGYGNEEFTHAAVAATVAAGRAEVGFGIQAAAAQFGLAFVPLASERYLFACRRRALDSPRVAAFRELLASDATRAVVAPLPGYALDAPGTLAPAAWLRVPGR
jgi:molybdate transport repressor ModE-like protein